MRDHILEILRLTVAGTSRQTLYSLSSVKKSLSLDIVFPKDKMLCYASEYFIGNFILYVHL